MEKTLANLIVEESRRFNNFVYCSQPYSCGIDEAVNYFRRFVYPSAELLEIERNEKETLIKIKKKPKAKRFGLIKLWIAGLK